MERCIFCDNRAGSLEHLWAAWMHRLIKFGPIRVQEGTRPEVIEEDPERTIGTVCSDCNNKWMSTLENSNKPALESMILNKPTMVDPGRLLRLIERGVKTAMVFDSTRLERQEDKFYRRVSCEAFKASRRVPARTRIWIGALCQPHLGLFGSDLSISSTDGRTQVGTASALTVIVGHFVMQVVTEHIFPQHVADYKDEVQPIPGISDHSLIQIYPKTPKKVSWPPTPFTNGGPNGIGYLMARWKGGKRVGLIKLW